MTDSTKKIIEHLKQHAHKYNWHGYTHSNCRSRKYRRKIGEAFYRTCLKTIIPDKLITIQLNRVYVSGYWKSEKEEFDPDKHFYWYEVIIFDELKRNGTKTILSIDCKKESEDVSIFQELFAEILKFSIFHDKIVEGSKENALDLLLSAI